MTDLFAMTDVQESQGRRPPESVAAGAAMGEGGAAVPAPHPGFPQPPVPASGAQPQIPSLSVPTPIAAIDKLTLFFNRELS